MINFLANDERRQDVIKVESMADIAKCVRETRRAQGVSQTVLSQLSNVGLRFLCEVEHGKQSVRFDKLLSVLTSLGIVLKLDLPPE
jgi:transcriptional regulator with XRE-family HTH domain